MFDFSHLAMSAITQNLDFFLQNFPRVGMKLFSEPYKYKSNLGLFGIYQICIHFKNQQSLVFAILLDLIKYRVSTDYHTLCNRKCVQVNYRTRYNCNVNVWCLPFQRKVVRFYCLRVYQLKSQEPVYRFKFFVETIKLRYLRKMSSMSKHLIK